MRKRNILITVLLAFLIIPSGVFGSGIHPVSDKNKDELSDAAAEESVVSTLAAYEKLPAAIPISGNVDILKYFFEALKNSQNKKLRIAHYGDSVIWGDVISSDLRKLFQRKFDGSGLGLLSLGQDDVTVRKTVHQKFSTEWEWHSLFTRNPDRLPMGICGTIAVPKKNDWVNYKLNSSDSEFDVIRLFYSNVSNGASVAVNTAENSEQLLNLNGTSDKIQEVQLKSDEKLLSVQFDFSKSSGGYFYGISFESGNGVYLDNFPLRGNSGVSLGKIAEKTFSDFKEMLNYKLIILNFGLNVAEAARAKNTNYKWYHKKMVRVINYLKKIFPETSFLLISIGDKAIKSGSRFKSDPSIFSLLKVQKQIAKESNIAFWNLFEAMGGKNSMLKWVNSSPSLAFKDYAHFTPEGGEKIANMLFDALMAEFDKSNALD